MNIYGFHKGKNENGHDIFRHDIFLKGRKELLGFIRRNQKRHAKNSAGKKEEQKKTSQDVMQEIYNKISKLQTEQIELDSMVKKLEHKTQAIDLSSQGMMSSFYKKYLLFIIIRELQSTMTNFAVFILGHYLNRPNKEIEILGNPF